MEGLECRVRCGICGVLCMRGEMCCKVWDMSVVRCEMWSAVRGEMCCKVWDMECCEV